MKSPPFRDGFLVFLLLVMMACFGNWFLYSSAETTFVERMHNDFKALVIAGASVVDGDAHESLVSAEQEKGEVYARVVAPLKKLRDAIPNARFVYTTKLIDGKVYFIVDSTPVGDVEGDGVEDHAFLMDFYDDADTDLIEALRSTTAAVSKKPYTDKWGTFISAYAPIKNSAGQPIAALCIDLKAEDYMDRILRFQKNALKTLMMQILIALFLGITTYWLRTGSHQLRIAEKKAQDELRESVERFQILNRVVNDVVWDWDLKTDAVQWNDCVRTVLGYGESSRSMSFAWWEGNIHAEDRERVIQSVHEVVDGVGTLWSQEYRFLKGDGSYADILDRGLVIRDTSGAAIRMIGTMVDLTDRKKIEAKLLQSQKMDTVGTLAGGIAHDLNNQLTPVCGYLDMLLNEIPKESPTHALLEEANHAAKRCVEVVQGLLSFSRPSTQTYEPISLSKQMNELRLLLKNVLPATIEIHVSCAEEAWPVMGNDTELQTIFLNMAANARDAMKSGGTFSVSVRNVEITESTGSKHALGKYAEITVRDTGEGISAEVVNRIFEPFFTTKKRSEGTGLGLAMVFKIIANHKGWIDVFSQKGQGTMFVIYLPAQPDAPVRTGSPESRGGIPVDLMGKGELVLFVDDETVMRNLGKIFLERLGYRVLFAVDGEEAVRIYGENQDHISLIILDMTMPKITGRETMSRLFKVNPAVKILLMTGYTSEGQPQELIAAGAKSLIPKPYTILSLASFIKKSIA